MKRFYIALAVLLSMHVMYAQTDPLRDKLDNVFYYIDKSQVPTGFLEEYGPALVPLDVFNGVTTDSNKANIDVWRMAYQTLYASRIYGTNPLSSLANVNSSIATEETINNTQQHITSSASSGAIPVAILYCPYNYLRPDALDANLLSVSNDQLYDVPGRGQSPYNTRTAFLASPTVNYAHNGTISLVFKQSLFYNFSGKTANSLQVDFNDGTGYQSASWDTPVTSHYATPGTKDFKIKIVFTDNSSMECYSILEVIEVSNINPQARYGDPTQPAPITVPFVANSNHSGGTLFIDYDKNDAERTLNKPLIVIEGYDVSFIAPKLQDNYSFTSFVNGLNRIQFVYDLNNQLDNVAGYDLVFLDFNNGTDDIVRNAALVQEVIQWVNNNKAGSEQNVVMGISMGGLVARYALANMTKQSINPQTRLLITHDSPHRGANTPLGFQFFTRQVSEVHEIQTLNLFNILPSVEQANALLDQPATQQLLIARATNGSGGVSYNTFLDGAYRSMITFPTNGPQPTYRMIATSLGAECGQPNLNPSTELLHVNGNYFFAPLPWIDRTSHSTEVIINSLPPVGQSQLLSKLHVWTTLKILRVIHININHVNKTANSPNGLLPWDGAPGGADDVASQAGKIPNKEYKKLLPFLDLSIGATYFAGTFCFVPTVSALDVTTIDQPALTRVYAGGISPGNSSRMATFIAQEQINGNTFNERHPRFTARNAHWIFNEMENIINTLNCPASCQIDFSNVTITGSSQVCSSGSTYTLSNVPTGATVTWSTSSTLLTASGGSFVYNPNTQTGVTVYAKNNMTKGSATLTFSINTGCGNSSQVPPKTIWIGLPDFPTPIDGPSTLTIDLSANYHIYNGVGGNGTYTWTIGSPWYFYGATQTTTGTNAFLIARSSTLKTLTVSTINNCGTSSTTKSIMGTTACVYDIAVSPNPAKSGEAVINIIPPPGGCNQAVAPSASARVSTSSLIETATTTPEQGTFIVIKNSGEKIVERTFNGMTTDLKDLNLKTGIYYIKVQYKGSSWERKLIIN